ncbi:MAG TPA: glycosyltransferase [Ginsengibacter sp.]|nr:glycosyltransferase [Ginsengibacter sp.]
MKDVLVITPVKDSVDTALHTISAIHNSNPNLTYLVYNDFSTKETLQKLKMSESMDQFKLINLADHVNTPSPNYDFVLKDAQERALKNRQHLIVVESDVTVKESTLNSLVDLANEREDVGLAGAITVDEQEQVNFPYLKFKDFTKELHETRRSLSFCCTLISYNLLRKFSFTNLDKTKDWYDTSLSQKSIELGFTNIIAANLTVLHKPHSSRPWKQLKYSHPLKYYFYKFTKHRDKI